jgi:transposase-like protein
MKRKKEVTPRKIYSYAFKQQVVLEFDNGQISRRGLAKKYCISSTTLDRWIEKYSILAKNKRMAEKHSNDPRHKIKRLEKRIEELESMLEIDDMAWDIVEEMTGDPGLRKKFLPESQVKIMAKLKKSK